LLAISKTYQYKVVSLTAGLHVLSKITSFSSISTLSVTNWLHKWTPSFI